MALTGNAVVFTDREKVEFQEVELPDPGPDDVVVRTRYSWISNGTEGSYLRGERIKGDTPWREGDPWPFPIVAGYQKTGIVEWVGSNVEEITVGETVFATVSYVGEQFFEKMGGHVSPAVTPQSQIWKLPEELSPVAASCIVLAQVGYNCGTRPPVSEGDVAVVIGDGLVGHWSAQTLYSRGATVILAGKHDYRLERFPADGRRHRCNITTQELQDIARTIAPGGVSIVVDTVGSVPAIEACYPFMRHNSHIVSAGFHGTKGLIDIQPMRALEATLYAPSGWTRERMDATLEMLADGRLNSESLITHRFPAREAARAWELILKRPEPVLGVILEWEE